MSTNKKFRIQNGVDVKGELTVNDVVIIRADGTIVAGAIADAVSSLVDAGALTGSGSSIIDSDSQIFIDVNSNTVAIASETATRISDIANLQTQIDSLGVNADTQAEVDSLQTQIDSIVGASPETLDTLVEIVSAFEGADSDIQALLAANSSSLSANTAAIGVETTQRIAGDVTLQQNIDAEVTRATAAEQANAAAIAAEAATRGAAVSALQASQFTYSDSDGWTGNLIPSADNQYALGSPDRVWKDLYIGPGSLYINGTKILEDNSGTITMYADAGQNLSFGATGGGNIDLNAGDESVQLKSDLVMSVGETISTVGGAPTKFGGSVDMGTHQVSNLGTPVDPSDAATKEYVDGLNAEGTISGDKVFEGKVTIQGDLSVEGTTTTLDTQTLTVADNIIDLNSNVTTGVPTLNAGIRIMRGDEPAVQLRWNELEDRWEVYDGVTATAIAVESTDGMAEGPNNLYFTVVRAREAVSQDIADAVAAEAASRGAAIDAEIARATSAETQLAADIVAEATARADADSDESAARIAGDATLQSAVDAEQAARIAADLSEAQTRAAAVSDLQNQLNTISNTDLSSLQSQLDAIVGTSPETLDTLQEVVAAFEGADSDIQTLLANNSSTLSDLSDAITDEINNRNFAIAVEKQQREDADEALQASIDAVSATVSSNNAAKSSAISAESAARIAGDSDLNALIDANSTAEATARVAGDATVQAAVDAEVARATAAEGVNAAAISAEETRALAAEADLQNQINQVEATGATHPLFSTLADLPDATANHGMFAHVHAEGAAYFAHAGQWVKLANFSDLDGIDLSSIQSQIDAIVGSSPETLDTLQEIVAAFESADGDLQTLMTANSSAISDLESYAGHVPQTVTIPERIFTALRSQKIVMMDMDGSNVFTHASDLRLGPNGQPSNYTNYGKHLASNGSKIAVAMDMTTWSGVDGKVILSDMDGSNEIEIQGTDWVGAPNSLAMSDNYLYVGHNLKDDADSTDAGAVHIYNLDGGFVKTIANRYDGVMTHDQEFGTTVTYNKEVNKLVVSATVNAGNGYSSYIGIYDESGNLERYIDDPVGDNSATRFGISVAMTSDKVIVGSYGTSDSENGKVYVFNLLNGSLVTTMTGPTITSDMLGGTRQNTSWGYEVSTNGSKILVGSQTESSGGVDFKGAVYVYDMNGNFETKITPSVETSQFGMNIMAGTNHVVVSEYNKPKIYVYDLDGSNEQIITVDEASSGFTGSFEAGIVIIPETQVTLDAISLDTTATTLAGAINELHAEMADNSATSTAVQAETDARVAAVSAEETARIAGDAANASAIVSETNARYAADTTETQARISADNALDAKITAEESARLAGVSNLQLQVNAVSQSIADADNVVRTEFAAADSDLQTQITALQASDAARQATGATSDEVVAVQEAIDSAEASLQSQIDNIVGSSPETLDTLQEIVAAYEGADGDLQTLISGNSSTLSTLSADVESAENAVEELTTDVHGPVLNFYPFSNNWQEYYNSGEGYQSITEYDNGTRVNFYNAVNGGYTGFQHIYGLEPNTAYSFNAVIESASQDSRTVKNIGNNCFLRIGIQAAGTTYDNNEWITDIHTTNGQQPVSQTYPKYANLSFTSDSNGYAAIRVAFTQRWSQAIIKEFSIVEQANPTARELLETTAQQLVPAVNEVRSSLLSKESALQSQITVNANAIVAVDADRQAFETSVNADRQSHRDEVQAQIDQVNADRTAFESSVNAGRDSHEASTLALAAAFRDSVEADVTLLREVFEGHVADINQTASAISQRHGSGVLDFPNEATSITYDKEVLDQYYVAKVSNDEFYFYNSSNFDYSTNSTNILDTGIRVPFPSGVNTFNDHVLLTREYFIAASSGTSGSFYVYDLTTISASSTPLVVVPHDGFCLDITHDGKDDRFFARKGESAGSSVRAWDLPSIVSDTPVYLEVSKDDIPAGHDVTGFANDGIATNTNHVFVPTSANTIVVLNRSDLSFVTCIVNGDTSGSGSNEFGRYIQASDTMLVSSGWMGYDSGSDGNDYSGGSASNIWVYDASDFNNFVKVNGNLSNDDTAKRPEWRMSSISRFWTNRQIAVNNDFVFVKVWGRWDYSSGGVVGLRREDIFNGTWYNNLAFQVTQNQITYSQRDNMFNSYEDHEFGRTLHITADKLLIEHGDAKFKGADDNGNLLYIYDLTVTPDATNNRIDLNAQYPQVLEESNDGQWGYPQLSSTGTLTVSVTETFTPNESLTSAINYIHNKNQELETSVSAITGNSTFLSDLQAVEANVDFKLLAQDARFDSDKAEQTAIYDAANAAQTAIYAAANAEQAAIYDSANAAHVAYFEQYTSGETAARELADQNLQSQITSNDGDIVSLQSQIDTIVGTSPETLDTLQEIVTYFDNADNTLQGVVTSNETKVNSLLASLDEMGVDSKGIFGDDVATAADASHGDIFFDRSTGKIYKGVVTDAAAGNEILTSGHGAWMGTSHQGNGVYTWLDFGNRRISDAQPNYNTFTYTFAEPINIAAMNFTNQYYIDITSVTYEDGTVESLGVQNYVRPADETRKITSIFLTCTNPSHKTYGWSYFDGITVSTFAWEEITVEMLGHVLLANAGDDQVREELMVNISALENYVEINGTLDTTSQTLTGAINELNTSVQSITGSDTQFLDDIATNQTNIAGHDSDFVDVRGRLDVIEDTSVPNLQAQIDVHSGQIATEVADRTSGDAALQAQIDNIVGTSPETLDTLQEVVSTFQNADNDLQALITGNTSIVSTHTTQIATLDNQIHGGAGLNVPNMPTQVSRWVYQDQYIVATSSATEDVPVGHVLVFDANNPLATPTILSPEGFGSHIGSGSNMGTPKSAKIIRDKVVVGYPYSDPGNITNVGEVYVWDLNDLSADPVVLNRYGSGMENHDYFGWSVTGSADHNYIIVGEWGQDYTGKDYLNAGYGVNSGRVYLYDINNLTNQPIILDPSGIQPFWRANSSYSYNNLQFGRQVNVDGDYLYVTVTGSNNYGTGDYNTFILVYDLSDIQATPSHLAPTRTQWSDEQDSSYFGLYSNNVAYNDNYVAVSSYYGPNASFDGLTQRHGTVYVWAKNADGYAEGEGSHVYAIQSPDSQQYDYFGRSIAMDDTRLYVGSTGWDGVQGGDVGKVEVFDLSDGSHIQTIYAYDGNAYDNFGQNMSVNGGKLIVAANGDDDNSSYSGSLYIYDTSALSGIPIKVSEAFLSMNTHGLGSEDLDLTVASGAVEIIETILPNASLSDGINYLESKTEELKVQVQNVNNSGALTAMSNSNRLDVVETEMDLLESADSAEQAARIAGDASLQSQIDNLTIAASGDVSVESAARIAGDSDEAAARVAGDATVQAAVDAEVARATGVESGLQSQLDAIVGTSPETLDTLQEVVAAFEGADGDLQTLITTNASTISDLDAFVGGGVNVNLFGETEELPMSAVNGDLAEAFTGSGTSYSRTQNGRVTTIDITEDGFILNPGKNAGFVFMAEIPVLLPFESTFQLSYNLNVSGGPVTNLTFNISHKGDLNDHIGGSDNLSSNAQISRSITTSADDTIKAKSLHGDQISGIPAVVKIFNGDNVNEGNFHFSDMFLGDPSGVSLETTAQTVTTAINEVHSELNAEVLRAQTAEGAEEVRALAAEAVLQSNINTESSARLAGDAGLQSQIDTLSGTQTSDKSALEVSIANETARATAAEGALQSAIDAEELRATTAEGVNAAAVVTEKVRAEAVEAGLAADIAVETARATAAETQLANHLGANFTDGSITIDGLATFNGGLYFGDGTGTIGFNASVDHIQSLSDLDMMSNSVINVAAPVDSADAANKAYVDATTQVVSDRVDAILNGAGESLDTIVEVVAAFENADSDIQSLITSNSASVTANTNAINAEVAARQQAITDEATARANADSDLSAGLSTELSRALSAEGVLTSDLAAEVARATSAETGLASDIAAETSRATAAEGVNASAISAETTRATTVEASLAQDIADESLRAQGAEAVLTSDVSANATAISNLQSQVAGVSTSSGSSNIEMTAEVDMSGNKITGMADPTAAQDAATKSYVDASVATEATARTTEDSSLQSNIDATNARIDAILNGSVESLDTVVEVVSAFEGADSDIQNLITANASTISQNATAIATEATARANADSDESALRAAADAVLTADLAATNARTAGIDASSGTIEVSSNVDMNDNNITGVNDVYASRGFIDRIESEQLIVETGTVSFQGSTVDFGSATITGGGFSSATNAQIDQHLNVSAADSNEFLKWNGTDYEFTDYIQGRIASTMIEVEGTLKTSQPGSTIDWQNGLVHFGGSQVIVDTPTSAGLAANKSYVDNADSDLNASLSTAIANEESRATTAEGVLTTNLANEISRATSAEAGLASDISAEETRALAAEAAEASARADADSDLQSAIDAEVARATAAEAVNAQAVVDEATARTTADTTLQSNIDTVSGRVDAILNGSSESLDTIVEVVAAFENADSDLQTLISSNAGSHTANTAAISAEETRALAAEGVLQSAIDAEETRATGVESGLQSQITSEIASRSAADQSMKDDLDSDIAAEAALRSAGDATLQSAIDVEVARATAAEGVLQSLLDSEQSARILSDQGLQSAITAEENARVAADAVLQSAIDAEASARAGADNTLQSNIDTVSAAVSAITNGSPETLNQLVEVVAAFEDADSDIQTLISNLGGDASALTARVSTLEGEMDATELATTSNANAISAETAARVAAVQVNADAITAESTARAAAITAEQNARAAAIAASESDRDSADADLQAQITALSTTEQTSKSSLQALLSQEVADRTAGDSDLTDSLAAEVARATAAESALSSDISAEESARVSADASLQSQIDSILSNTDATALNSLAEIVTEFQSVDGTLTGLISSNGSRITSLESSVGTINSWTTDNLSEGTINKYWTEQRTKDCLTGGLCIDYNSTTGEIAIDETEAASALHVASSGDANALGGQAPSHYRINVYDAAGNLVN